MQEEDIATLVRQVVGLRTSYASLKRDQRKMEEALSACRAMIDKTLSRLGSLLPESDYIYGGDYDYMPESHIVEVDGQRFAVHRSGSSAGVVKLNPLR